MAESLFQLGGSQPTKQYHNVPISTSTFFSGLWTQRSPFGSPDSRYYTKTLGGRTDILIDGLNTELTNYGTLIRRPGTSLYSSASLGSSPLTFYSFHQLGNLNNPIQIIADTVSNIYTLTPSLATSIMTKANGSGQSYFQGIGSTLYIGDGVDLQAWTGTGATRNWGIAMNSTADTTGPNACGTGTDVPVTGGTAWTNPGNITANDGAFSTVTLPAPSSGSTTVGPNAPTIASVAGSGLAWGGPNNIKVQDGVFATAGANGTTQELQGSGYNFGIPASATINGITVDVWWSSGTITYGGPSTLWGTTWTPSEINNSGFGVQVSATGTFLGGFTDNDVTLLKSGSPVGNNLAGGNTIVEAIDFISITISYTGVTGDTTITDYLEATNFGFGLSLANTVSGVLVEVKGLGNSQPAGTSITIQILKNGMPAGTAKTGNTLPGSNSFTSYGGSSDLWGTTFSAGDVNNASFGVLIQGNNSGTSSGQWSIDFVRITTFGTGGPTVATTGTGNFNAVSGYQYVYAYGNSNSGHISNPTPPSANTGPFGGIISATTLGSGGTLYAINDTGIINAGQGNATYTVNTVSASGAVLTYTINNGGSRYIVANNVPTAHTGAQAGNGGFFTVNITSVTGVASVQVTLVASTDPQVNQIRVFRTVDGGSTYFELPSSPYSNTSTTISDSSSDSSLNKESAFTTSPSLVNSVPPAGLGKMTYHLNRVWGVVNNNVYYSALAGDDITLGVGAESWPPSNVFVFPTVVNKLMPIASGLLVFTTDDVYLISGNNRNNLFSQLFQQGVGLLSWNALDVEGNQIFMYTSDRQFISFSASGPSEIGFPIGVDIQNNFDPSSVYVAALVAGTQDKAVFLSDGTANWYRCNWNQPPEGGPAWSPLASIVGGATAVVSVETSPGIHQLMIGQSNGTVLVRNYSTFSDNGTSYAASATIGSLILAKPGQLAALESIILELQNVGSIPTVSLLLDEIGGSFETLLNSVTDPPNLIPSQTVMSRRWYLAQGQASAFCRHIQLKIGFPSEAAKNEVLSVTEIGALVNDK